MYEPVLANDVIVFLTWLHKQPFNKLTTFLIPDIGHKKTARESLIEHFLLAVNYCLQCVPTWVFLLS
jgi:hypothetical protein